ncbi:MAG: family 10 glycosylhydrolase [Synechococcales cyanobacterium C42_A2020_086]|nr:family 10 glycosylhydrolase [Synechococcales cyanobacterium C42_A2020_086]
MRSEQFSVGTAIWSWLRASLGACSIKISPIRESGISHLISQWWRLTRQLRFVLLLGLSLSLVYMLRFPSAATAQAVAAASPATEIRGVWLTNVDSEVLLTKDNLRQALRRLERLNFNTIYPVVWNGGYTLYPSQVAREAFGEEIDPEPGLQDRDMLREAVEMGHNRDLSVIPWFEFGLMAPADSELVRRHPDWVTTRRDGTKVFNVHGDDRSVWLNPAHPGVQDFLVKLVTEVVDRYNVDGIQFDDHLGMPVEVGYDAYTIQLYQQEHNGNRPPENARNAEWMRWRANKLSDLMVKLYTAIKTRKPDCIISLSPNPRDFAYQNYLQDWYAWQRLGLIDELIVQVYRTNRSHFVTEIDRPELRSARSRIPVGIGILTGLRTRSVQTQSIEEQVRLTRDRRFSGVSFFFYESLGQRDAVFQALFPEPAERPAIASASARS